MSSALTMPNKSRPDPKFPIAALIKHVDYFRVARDSSGMFNCQRTRRYARPEGNRSLNPPY